MLFIFIQVEYFKIYVKINYDEQIILKRLIKIKMLNLIL